MNGNWPQQIFMIPQHKYELLRKKLVFFFSDLSNLNIHVYQIYHMQGFLYSFFLIDKYNVTL